MGAGAEPFLAIGTQTPRFIRSSQISNLGVYRSHRAITREEVIGMDKLFLAVMMLVLTEIFRLLRDRRIERSREERERLEHLRRRLRGLNRDRNRTKDED